MPQFTKFRNVSYAIINKSIDNSFDDSHVSRKDFWERFYLPRKAEIQEFDDFVQADSEILVVSGHVGTGKSTFIRHKYECGEQRCVGIIFDMRSHRDSLKRAETLLEDVHKLVLNGYRDQIRLNIKYMLLNNYDYKDFSYLPPEIPEGQSLNDPGIENKCWNKLAMLALTYLQGDEAIWQYTQKLSPNINFETTEKFEADLLVAFEQKGYPSAEVISMLKWYHYVILYRQLGKHTLPHIFVFDNLDWPDLDVTHGQFFVCIQSMLQEYNTHASPYFQSRRAKAVVAIRDENLARFQFQAASQTILTHLRFGPTDYVLPWATQARTLVTGPSFSYEVVQRRLAYMEEKMQQEHPNEVAHFSKIIKGFWIEEDHFRREIARFQVQSFCNGSFRLMLDLIHESTCDILNRMQIKGRNMHPDQSSVSLPVLRGRIIYSLRENADTANMVRAFSDSVQNELIDDYCCIFRLILVYLSRRKNEECFYYELAQDFRQLFPNRNEKDLRNNVYHLYSYFERQGELITIYQQSELEKPEQIDENARIRMNGRGREFCATVLPNLDFFGGIIAHDYSAHHGLSLHEMAPNQAYDYTKKILALVTQLADQHIKFVINSIYPILPIHPNIKPFTQYSKKFTYEDKFHLERACINHKIVIRSYLEECLKGPEHNGLLLNAEEIEELRSVIPKCLLPHPQKRTAPDKIRETIEHLPTNNRIAQIWNDVYKKYDQILDSMQKLRDMNWTEV